MSKAVDIIDGVLFVHTRHYDDVNRVIICHQKKPLRVFSDDAEKELGRPHGEWIIRRDKQGTHIYSVCSRCNVAHLDTDFPNFCENCGSDNRKRGEVE